VILDVKRGEVGSANRASRLTVNILPGSHRPPASPTTLATRIFAPARPRPAAIQPTVKILPADRYLSLTDHLRHNDRRPSATAPGASRLTVKILTFSGHLALLRKIFRAARPQPEVSRLYLPNGATFAANPTRSWSFPKQCRLIMVVS
jgi:hypothetical protein